MLHYLNCDKIFFIYKAVIPENLMMERVVIIYYDHIVY